MSSLAQSDIDIDRQVAIKGSGMLLTLLQKHHGEETPEDKPPTPVEVLPPIPNDVIAEAAKIAFPDWVNAITKIKYAVCIEFDISPVDLISERRTLRHVIPRQVGMFLCKKITTRSLPEIGRKFGGRDHTTVLHAVGRVEVLMERDPQLRTRVAALAEAFGASI
jgi:hypothetical protein